MPTAHPLAKKRGLGQEMSGEAPESREGQAPTTDRAGGQPSPGGTHDRAPQASTGPTPSVAAAPPLVPLRAIWLRIKHHKVVQWTLAYLALAYTLLHTAEMLGNSLGWSHGLQRLFTLLLILGVPVVAIVSWYHGARGLRHVSGTELMIIAILLAMGGTFLWRDSKTEHAAENATIPAGGHRSETGAPKSAAAAPAPPAASIAVLAFSDLSAEGNQGYFSDGIAEEILNVLAHVNGLKVASRQSSFQFRKSDLGAPAIAQQLGVRHILEGSVRKAGDTVRITAQLIDARTDQHEWSQSFDRPLSTANLFAIQDEIAKTIVDHLTATMGSAVLVAEPTARKADTTDVDAYDLYLKGRSLFIDRSRENLVAAAVPLKAAVGKDPKFARAWELLGAVLVTRKYWGVGDESDRQAGADAIEMALRLDPNLSLAYAVRGEVQTDRTPSRGAVGWEESTQSYSRAIERDATNATAYLWRGANYAALGYLNRAMQDYQRCLDIDPAYELCRRHISFMYLFLGRADDALRLYEMGLESGYIAGATAVLAPAAVARGDRLGALSILAAVYQPAPQLIRPLFRAVTDPTFSEHDRQDALELVNRLKTTGYLISSTLWLLKVYDERIGEDADPPIWWARDDAAWLKSQGRKQVMQHWHLPEYWRKHGFPPQCRPIGDSDFECR
jgi:adenylate cyclase